MQTAGVIIEYNPMHMGHVHLLEEVRRLLGPDRIIGVTAKTVEQARRAILAAKEARPC